MRGARPPQAIAAPARAGESLLGRPLVPCHRLAVVALDAAASLEPHAELRRCASVVPLRQHQEIRDVELGDSYVSNPFVTSSTRARTRRNSVRIFSGSSRCAAGVQGQCATLEGRRSGRDRVVLCFRSSADGYVTVWSDDAEGNVSARIEPGGMAETEGQNRRPSYPNELAAETADERAAAVAAGEEMCIGDDDGLRSLPATGGVPSAAAC